jgi:predicted O-methyltransferase YrrM
VADLPALYGQPSPPAWPPSGGDKPLDRWKMETDDAPILEYLWRLWRPRRHLEFGTWEGFGATLVGQSTGAEIWTINLPQGESGSDGESPYASSDAGDNIGWRYRAAGFGPRVQQLLCDSRDFETNRFASNFFDTVLIDGGHTPDVVENDTDKALSVLHPGGLCIWHDFCPDAAALSRNLAPLGVVQAIVENIGRWQPLFERLYWIRKSWILVGERKPT